MTVYSMAVDGHHRTVDARDAHDALQAVIGEVRPDAAQAIVEILEIVPDDETEGA